MAIRAEEISDILVKEIEGYDPKVKDQPYGTVVQVGDNIATVYGLRDARAGELLAWCQRVAGGVPARRSRIENLIFLRKIEVVGT